MPEDLPWHLESECSAYTEFMHALISQVGSQVTLRRINRITARFRHPCPFSLLALLYVALTISPFIQVPTMPSYNLGKVHQNATLFICTMESLSLRSNKNWNFLLKLLSMLLICHISKFWNKNTPWLYI